MPHVRIGQGENKEIDAIPNQFSRGKTDLPKPRPGPQAWAFRHPKPGPRPYPSRDFGPARLGLIRPGLGRPTA